MARKRRWAGCLTGIVLVGAAVGAYLWLSNGISPMAAGPKRYIRWERPVRIGVILADLRRKGIIRNTNALRIYAWIRRTPSQVQTGTYELAPGMSADQILNELQKPIRQMVRLPETNWARRTANLLQKKAVLNADEYLKLVHDPQQFKDKVAFPLPKDSLEGYLYPDTYDLPPLVGARRVIEKQLANFQKKVWEGLKHPKNLHEVLTKASLVELEAGADEDRPKIAGVIENRLKKHMRLQLDAALLYGIQKWRRLTFADYKTIDSPYNLYKYDGLPPGPICSPTVKSINAVLKPAKHNDVFYVALPDGKSLFAPTYEEHKRNIRKRIHALKLEEQEKTTE